VHDDRILFEFLTARGRAGGTLLEHDPAQREGYAGFCRVRSAIVAGYGGATVRQLMTDPGIVRNRSRFRIDHRNAQALLPVEEEFGSFDSTSGVRRRQPSAPRPPSMPADVPATTPESDAMSKELKKRGFRFVGSTICYAFMQACGLADDHRSSCFRSVRRSANAVSAAMSIKPSST